MRTLNLNRTPSRQRGLSVIEILVGLLIGMIGIVVIFSVLSLAESRKRTTAAGSDAQVAGAMALFALERDLQTAGFGFGTFAWNLGMNCTVLAHDAARSGWTGFPLAPVVITQGAAGPDQLATLYGNDTRVTTGTSFGAAASGPTFKDTSPATGGRSGIQTGAFLLVAGKSPTDPTGSSPDCQLVQVTSVTDPGGVRITHDGGRYNSSAGAPAFADGGFLFDLGNAPRRSVWTVENNRLVMRNDISFEADGVPVVAQVYDDIIDLQAEYGVVNPPANSFTPTWTTTAPTDMSYVYAVRVALLARSRQAEKTKVTTTAPSWSGGSFAMKDVTAAATSDNNPGGTDGDPTNWRNYRYRVYETVVPIRNSAWGRSSKP